MKSQTKKPGEFKAECRLTRRVPERKMTPELWETALAADYRREFREMPSENVDKERRLHGRWEIVFQACPGFKTTDRDAFAEHMAQLHGRKPSGPAQIRLGRGHWRAPQLREEGVPFKDSTGVTETCVVCGLVAQTESDFGSAASSLWWREHTERCVGAERGAA